MRVSPSYSSSSSSSSSSKRLVALLPCVIAQRLEGSRFGACFVALANSFHHEPGRNARQRAAPGNDPALRSSMRRT